MSRMLSMAKRAGLWVDSWAKSPRCVAVAPLQLEVSMSAAYHPSVFTPSSTFPHQFSTYIHSQLLGAISIASSVTISVDITLPDTMNQVWVGHPWPSKSECLLRIQLDDWWSGHFYCCVYDRLEILPFTNISLVMDCVGGGTLEKLFSEDPLERI